MIGKTIVAAVDGTVENEYNGFLVEPKESDILAKGIVRLYKEDEAKLKFEQNGYLTQKNKFGFEIFLRKYKHYYRSLLNGGHIFE